MSDLLKAGKLESARIRVEGIIRSDIETELHEILELYCELMLARIGLLEGTYTVPAWLKEEFSGKPQRDSKAVSASSSGGATAVASSGVAARLASVLSGRSTAPAPPAAAPSPAETNANDPPATNTTDVDSTTASLPLLSIPDAGLCESILAVIYCAPRLTDTKELTTSRVLLLEKLGREVGLKLQQATTGEEALALGIPERVVKRLNFTPPSPELVDGYLKEIGRFYNVKWPGAPDSEDEEEDDDDDDDEGGIKESIEEGDVPDFEDDDDDKNNKGSGSGGGGGGGQRERLIAIAAQELSRATPPRETVGSAPPLKIAPPSPSTENVHPKIKLPTGNSAAKGSDSPLAKKSGKKSGGGSSGTGGRSTGGGAKKETSTAAKKDGDGGMGSKKDGPGGKIPDVDELSKRFEALKRL
jgi:vacuolar protein sorting-associated protein IST1